MVNTDWSLCFHRIYLTVNIPWYLLPRYLWYSSQTNLNISIGSWYFRRDPFSINPSGSKLLNSSVKLPHHRGICLDVNHCSWFQSHFVQTLVSELTSNNRAWRLGRSHFHLNRSSFFYSIYKHYIIWNIEDFKISSEIFRSHGLWHNGLISNVTFSNIL